MPLKRFKAILAGLDPVLAGQLSPVLAQLAIQVQEAGSEDRNALSDTETGIVFCSSEPALRATVMDAVERSQPGLPVVVVSRLPQMSEWLDAMESGAADYCAAPFEPAQIRWILESNLRSRRLPAVA